MEGKRGMEREGRVEGPLPQVTATALCIPTPCCALHKVLGLAGIAPGVGVLCVDQQVSIQAAEVLLTSCVSMACMRQGPRHRMGSGTKDRRSHRHILLSSTPSSSWPRSSPTQAGDSPPLGSPAPSGLSPPAFLSKMCLCGAPPHLLSRGQQLGNCWVDCAPPSGPSPRPAPLFLQPSSQHSSAPPTSSTCRLLS